jgi:hypothetical protein
MKDRTVELDSINKIVNKSAFITPVTEKPSNEMTADGS